MARGQKGKSCEVFDGYGPLRRWRKMIFVQEDWRRPFKKTLNKIKEITVRQQDIPSRIVGLEKRVSCLERAGPKLNQNTLCVTIVGARADGRRADEKMRRLAWIGIPNKVGRLRQGNSTLKH